VGTSYFYSIVYLVVVMAIATVLILTIPETGKREETCTFHGFLDVPDVVNRVECKSIHLLTTTD
jgi:competence protein ComGC